ncbi:MAG: hypothetical protein Q9M30_03135 [Mariprofundaceae bacterium]|nr:hypothetical protein [Mariprofundaceae bacterium]
MEIINTIGDLKTHQPDTADPVVLVLDYYEAGDGGGGIFRWDAGESALPDEGVIIESLVDAGKWKRVFSGPIHVNWFGTRCDGDLATGSGTDDSEAVQKAITFARENGYSDIYFNNVGTYTLKKVQIHPGLKIDLGGSTLIRTPESDFDSNGKSWNRMFTTEDWAKGNLTVPRGEEAVLTISNGMLDGNKDFFETEGAEDWRHEHDALLFLVGKSELELKATVSKVYFRNCYGSDAIAQWVCTDLSVHDCIFNSCDRGSIVLAGGASKLRFNNISCIDAKLHIEIETPEAVTVQGTNSDLGGGDSIGVYPGSEVLLDNIRCSNAPFTITSPESRVNISNSIFRIGEKNSQTNRITFPGDITFSHCKFILTKPRDIQNAEVCGIHIYWNTDSNENTYTHQKVRLNHCEWTADEALSDSDKLYAVYSEGDDIGNHNAVMIHGGSVSPDFDTAFYMYGGRMYVDGGCVIRATEALHAEGTTLGNGSLLRWRLEIGDIVLGKHVSTYAHLVASADSKIIHRGTMIAAAQNVFTSQPNYGLITAKGFRMIMGNSPPSGFDHALQGDIWRLEKPRASRQCEWVATGQSSLTGAVGQATWKAISRA